MTLGGVARDGEHGLVQLPPVYRRLLDARLRVHAPKAHAGIVAAADEVQAGRVHGQRRHGVQVGHHGADQGAGVCVEEANLPVLVGGDGDGQTGVGDEFVHGVGGIVGDFQVHHRLACFHVEDGGVAGKGGGDAGHVPGEEVRRRGRAPLGHGHLREHGHRVRVPPQEPGVGAAGDHVGLTGVVFEVPHGVRVLPKYGAGDGGVVGLVGVAGGAGEVPDADGGVRAAADAALPGAVHGGR